MVILDGELRESSLHLADLAAVMMSTMTTMTTDRWQRSVSQVDDGVDTFFTNPEEVNGSQKSVAEIFPRD